MQLLFIFKSKNEIDLRGSLKREFKRVLWKAISLVEFSLASAGSFVASRFSGLSFKFFFFLTFEVVEISEEDNVDEVGEVGVLAATEAAVAAVAA
mmetsp:Transcript_30217/g.35659  ORF Transcript_30217/g.35659 Transcript_30217/m.35659 type:complete len:95 (+) Transcript_30217:1288-1572(+)